MSDGGGVGYSLISLRVFHLLDEDADSMEEIISYLVCYYHHYSLLLLFSLYVLFGLNVLSIISYSLSYSLSYINYSLSHTR